MATSYSMSLTGAPRLSVRRASTIDATDRVRLVGMGMDGVVVIGVQVRRNVEDDLLDGAGEGERCPVGVAAVGYQAVVLAHIEPRVAAEAERDGVLQPALAHLLTVDVQEDVPGGRRLGLVGREHELDMHVAGGQYAVGHLAVLEDAEERVGVLELAVLDVEREATQVGAVRDDDAL